MSAAANTSIDYEDEVFDDFEDVKAPMKSSAPLGSAAASGAVAIDDDLISAAQMAKKASGAAQYAGSDEDLEPVVIQLTITVQGAESAVLKFDDSISYDDFKKRLAAVGCDKVTYKNMSGNDATIGNGMQLDLFIDMMVDDFEGDNKLKGACTAIGSKISSAPVVESTSAHVSIATTGSDPKTVAPKAVAQTVAAPSPAAVVQEVAVAAVSTSHAAPAHVPSHQPIEAVALSSAEAIQAHGEFKPVASASACASSQSLIIAAVRDGSLKNAWQRLPELRHEFTVLDTQRTGVAPAVQVAAVLTRVLNLQPHNLDVQTLISVFGGDTGSVIIEQLLRAFTLLSPSALNALESARNSEIQNVPSVGGLRTFNCHSLSCGHDSTQVRCAVLDLCLENGADAAAPSIPAASLLSKYSSTSHKVDLASLTSVCAQVGAITDLSSMSVSPFHVTRNLAIATQHEVTLMTQGLTEQAGRRAVMSVADSLLTALRATSATEKRKSINPFASSKPTPKAKTEKAVIDALNSGCAGVSDALSYLSACPAADNISLIAFVEGLRWVESTGVLSDADCSSLGKKFDAVMSACASKDTDTSGVIPLSAFTAIMAQHCSDASVTSYCSSLARGDLIDYRNLLLQRILVLTAQESAVLASWTSSAQQSLRTFLVAHAHALNTQLVAAASKSDCVPRKTVKSCISKLPSIGTRASDQLMTQLLDGCTASSTADPDVFFVDTMSATSIRLLQVKACQDSLFLSRSGISAAAVASGVSEASCPPDKACKIVASAIPPHHSCFDIYSILGQFCSASGLVELYRAIQSFTSLPAVALDELLLSFHGPSSSAIHHLCTLLSQHSGGAPSAVKPVEDIVSAPGLPLAKALFKAAPSLILGHGALSMLLSRVSKSSASQVSVKGFLQQLLPSVAVLTPAILVLQPPAVAAAELPSRDASVLPQPPVAAQRPPPETKVSQRPLPDTKVSSVATKTQLSTVSASNPTESAPGLARARANFRKLIRSRRPSSLDVLRMLGVSTSLFPSALSMHEASGKGSLVTLLKTTGIPSSSLQVTGMWPSLKSVAPCSIFELRVIDAKFVPSAGAMYSSVHRKARVTFCNGVDGFFGSLAVVSAKAHRGDDHSWDFPSAQILSIAVSQTMMSAHPKGGVLIELSIVVSKKSTDGQAAAPAASSAAGRDMSAGWVMVPWADLKAGTSTLTLTGGLPWAHQKIQPEDCGSKKKFFGLSKSQPSVSSITLRLDAAGEAAHFPDKCVCHKNAVPLLQLFSLFLRSQISSLLGQSSAVRNPMFHNLLLSAFPSLINEVPLRNALIAQFSELGGNTKGSLATFSDPQNRDVLNQIKFLHRAVSLLQGLNWGVAALHEDEDAASRKEKLVKSFAADPIAFLSGKVSSADSVATETWKFEPTRAKELFFTIQMQ